MKGMVMIMVSEERIKTNLILMDSLDYWDELTLKAIDDDQAGYMSMWSKEKERKISKESLEVISRMR